MLTLSGLGQADQTINKSRFLAFAHRCDGEQAVAKFLRAIAAQHQNASHLAYAYRIKTEDGIVPRFSDAGEPSGTAGMPILKLIEGRDFVNVCVGVIRYYGGINLGTGGLARAYGGTAKMALDAAKTVLFVEMAEIDLVIDYKQMDAVTRALNQVKGRIIDKKFDTQVHLLITLPVDEVKAFIARF